MAAEYRHLDHKDIEPLFNSDSKTLILGSFPSVKSRQAQFYYGHPQNRFWRIMRALYDPDVYERIMMGEAVELPGKDNTHPSSLTGVRETTDLDVKKAIILEQHFALWDTIYSCSIIGSSDSTIKDVVVCDFTMILSEADIENIYCNGTASYNLFMKYAMESIEKYCIGRRTVPGVIKLPSTSPANAAWTMQKLLPAWSIIKK